MTGDRLRTAVRLDDDQVWQEIDAQRLAVADLLDTLTDDEWRRPSLCAAWTVRDVAAHLTLQQLGLRDAARMMIRFWGDIDRAVLVSSRERAAALPTEQITARIRGGIGSRRHNVGVTHLETLIDVLVHAQDIAIPLGRHLALPPEAAATAATRTWTTHWPPPPPAVRRLAGFRLTATDVDWSVGQGPGVEGPMGALLLLGTGRFAALPRITGEGAAALTHRLSAASH